MRASALEAPDRVHPLADLSELTKPGITSMVIVTAALGLLLASGTAAPLSLWLYTLVGTGLVSAGASALNHLLERHIDARMRRTASRPLPAGRLHPDLALLLGAGLAVLGLLLLAWRVNLLTACLGVAAFVGYVFVYTPMKRVSSLATVVGGIPGSIPPMMGWTAWTGSLDPPAWVLFGILFFWQMPHFLAIAWICRDDYARAGLPMLSTLDPDGRRTSRQAVLYALPLIPMSLLPTGMGLAGNVYLAGALFCGVLYLWFSLLFARRRDSASARWLLWASLVYLPAVLGALALDGMLR